MPVPYPQPAPALVLFDIDGTLLRRAGPHHRLALIDAIRRVSGLETTTDGVPLHGMLDPDILERMIRAAGGTARFAREAMPEIIRWAEVYYARTCPDLRRKTCPGVRPMLRALHRRDVTLGLVTGNLSRIGWKKMERAGLKSYFRFGAFGEMARDRTSLARLAIREAYARGWIRRNSPITLIGDAPADVIAAKRNGIRSVAVSTGISTPLELAQAEPDLLVPDLGHIDPALLAGG